MKLTVPDLSLVVLVGISGSGKSTFARQHFAPPEVLSSDACRALVSNDENDQGATRDAFDVLRYIAAKRLERKLLTVVDATNVQPDARKPLVELANEYHVLPVAIVFDLPLSVCKERNRDRPDRDLPNRVLQRQQDQLRRALRSLKREGFRYIHILDSIGKVEAAEIERNRPWTDRSDDHGPFDIIGDIHGCFDEAVQLLERLGYDVELAADPVALHRATHPQGRRAIFLGDLVDRGPRTPDVLRLAMGMAEQGAALCIPGNHEEKLKRALQGRDVKVAHGLGESLDQLEPYPQEFKTSVVDFLDGLVSHFVLDDGQLVVAHAGMTAQLAGRASRKVRDFALYGETTGETDEYGLRVRYRWAADYRGPAAVVYGHTPVPAAEWLNNTICIDTGCVFGGKLTALRWPERELVSVAAKSEYYEPVRPREVADPGRRALQHEHEDLLDVTDVLGKRQVATRLMGNVTVREEEAAASLETVSRFTIDPKWLVYLPPTMAPAGTATTGPELERPELAWEFFRREGIRHLVCEEKHMGSRAVLVVTRHGDTPASRFGAEDGRRGVVYTRTGRPFFDSADLEQTVIERVAEAAESAGVWDELDTAWLVVDAEILPWNVKAHELIVEHYSSVGAAATATLEASVGAVGTVAQRTPDADAVLERLRERAAAVAGLAPSYHPYVWDVTGLDDIRIAPFHLLASETGPHHDRPHPWHLDVLGRMADADDALLTRTAAHDVDLEDETSPVAATRWWEVRTATGAEGMVVKPRDFTVRGRRGLVQPGVKVRGREYLRLIYGPEYALEPNLERVRQRSLGRKRSLALREYALGVEALQRFTERRPLRDVHECVFAVLALESDPVDPRL